MNEISLELKPRIVYIDEKQKREQENLLIDI